MTPEEIDAIIAAVGKKPHDRASLAARLSQVQDARRYLHKPPGLKKIRRAIEEVAMMVDSNPTARSLVPEIAAILDKARHLEAESKGRQLSYTDFWCGIWLPWIFKEQFGVRATTTHNGAYARFAAAVFKATGQKIKTDRRLCR